MINRTITLPSINQMSANWHETKGTCQNGVV